jgi:mitochondrial fission protein ELM1
MTDVCWVLTTGEAGMRSQALGLAEAVGLPIEEKRIVVRQPWASLPGGFLRVPLSALDPSGDLLNPPWPRLIVGCGRRSIGIALTVKRLSGGNTIAAYVQNPELARSKFDLIAAMPHDNVRGANVVAVPTALHRVTPERLAAAKAKWAAHFSPAGEPVLGVLVGGDNGSYRLTDNVVARLIRILKKARAEHGMRTALTPSRRTGEPAKRALASAFLAEPLGTLWDETGENPYFGILACADRLIVTAESISMISEALATGRPVHVLPLEGRGARHEAFLERIVAERIVSRIEADDLDWDFQGKPPIFPTGKPAERLRALLGV